MSFDDILKSAWRDEQTTAAPGRLAARVHRRRLRHRLQRGAEVTLTLIAIALGIRVLASGQIEPAHYLLLPFFIAYLPMAWAFILRAPRQRREGVDENTRFYARLRMSQLHTGLRDWWLARFAAWSLLAYAIAANVGVWLLGDAHWRSGGAWLLGFTLVWTVCTLGLGYRRRTSLLREYRAMKRLTGA